VVSGDNGDKPAVSRRRGRRRDDNDHPAVTGEVPF
jgi:hypothetical protein